jgi:hypothetical protein
MTTSRSQFKSVIACSVLFFLFIFYKLDIYSRPFDFFTNRTFTVANRTVRKMVRFGTAQFGISSVSEKVDGPTIYHI